MNLRVERKTFTDQCTIGELSVDGQFECFTLEDKVRPFKIHGQTAIPAGTYEVTINFSNKFKKDLPELLNVPNFEGIRIHSGNTSADTEGCILVGKTKGENVVESSRDAFNALFPKIQVALQQGKVFIEVVGGETKVAPEEPGQ
jgi:hypothetical protein